MYFKKYTVVFLLVLAGVLYWCNQLAVVVSSQEYADKKIVFPVTKGAVLRFSWRHSVNKTLVEEYFHVKDENELELYLVRYDSYGAGMPFLPEEGKFEQKNGMFELAMSRKFASIKMGIGEEAQLELYYNGNNISLYRAYAPGSLIQLEVKKRCQAYIQYAAAYLQKAIKQL